MTKALRAALTTAFAPRVVLGDALEGGAMAQVFRARETSLDREIVIKVLAPDSL
jgi:predicted unusual protein kinase regulating ubiquinone biosynthesis (AarF/ABC1/UbiB family)